jgi:hypothetical protein
MVVVSGQSNAYPFVMASISGAQARMVKRDTSSGRRIASGMTAGIARSHSGSASGIRDRRQRIERVSTNGMKFDS